MFATRYDRRPRDTGDLIDCTPVLPTGPAAVYKKILTRRIRGGI